jgi:2-keto-4-pentenoate hydratase/2-oxohepta-3-ene-1,7-dioic acid hydratase in catechol pathway
VKLASLPNGTRDGRLHVVSRDLTRAAPTRAAETLQAALDNWTAIEGGLAEEYDTLNRGGGDAFDPSTALAPLPRAWQWLDGSAFDSHGDLMDKVFGMEKKERNPKPLMYQGVSDTFYPPVSDVPFVSADDGIDFEGEFGVITDAVPIHTSKTDAGDHIRLLVQINDWSLRKLAPVEMKTGFGWVQAKPPCGAAPVAVTPDELGPHWRNCRVDLPLSVKWNGRQFGAASGYAMSFGFDDLVAHAAYSRALVAGTIIGSGTVSNETYRTVGSSCIAERRGIEILDHGEAKTGYMAFGDAVSMEVWLPDGTPVFGELRQRAVKAASR